MSFVFSVANSFSFKRPPAPGFEIGASYENHIIVNNSFSSSVYPNPFSSKLIVEFSDADLISIYNGVGEKIKTIALLHGQTKVEINTADLREGIYFFSLIKEGIVTETSKIVKN